MNTRRSLVRWATTLAVAFVASALPATGAAATVPPTEPTVPETTVPETTVPVAAVPGDQEQQEIVHSWALSPAGSLDPNEGGTRQDLSYESDLGEVIDDAVTLFNYGNEQLTFRVYSTDAFNNDQGQFDLLAGDLEPTDVGSWVTFPQEMITVPAGQQVTLPITITIPPDATPGDHTGAILASSATLGVGAQGQIVTLDRRTGTRLYIRVNGALFPELAVADVQTTYDHALNPFGGSARVTYRIENRGNVRLSGTATVSISGPFGLGEREVALPDVPELLPGEDITVTAEVDDVSAFVLDFTSVRVEPAGSADAGVAEAATGTDLTFAPPITILMVLLAMLFGLLALRAYQRHRSTDAGATATQENTSEAHRDREHQLT